MKAHLISIWIWLAVAAWAQTPPGQVNVWLGDGSNFDSKAQAQALQQMKKVEPKPQHIVVLFHGYNVIQESSEELYRELGANVQKDMQKRSLRNLVVGLQWQSAEPGNAVPWQAEETYLRALGRGRSLGRSVARQLLFAIQKQYPKVPVTFLAHSMGCEVAIATFLPDIQYRDDVPVGPAFQPKQSLRPNLVALAGSDIDYDLWFRSGVELGAAGKPLARMMWMTQSDYVSDRDKALLVRQVARGQAGGTFFPRMTERQYDLLFKNAAVMFDDEEIPESHAFVRYYDEERLARILPTSIYLSNPKSPKPTELAEAEAILKLPNRAEVFKPWLSNDHLTAQMYALWRLENLFCGGSKHFADETLDKVARLLRNTPSVVWREQKTSPCRSIREEYWPTEEQMTRAGAPKWAKPQD